MSWKYDYWIVKNYYNREERIQIANYIERNNDGMEKIEKTAVDANNKSKKNTNTFTIEWQKIKNYMGNLESSIHVLNEQNFGYHLYPFNDLSKALLNVYDSKKKGSYDWHYDSSLSDMFDCKLTILVNLSDKYTGGDLHFFNDHDYVVKDFIPGSLLIFKSHINHMVTPVKSGVRKPLTLFGNGPKFR